MTTSDEGVREIQLNGKQLVFLFMAVTVVSVVIFLCGVLVGRGVQRRTTLVDAPSVSAPDDAGLAADAAAPAPTGPTTVTGLAFPNRLDSPEPPAEKLAPPKRDVPAAAAPSPSASPAAPSQSSAKPSTPTAPMGASQCRLRISRGPA